MIIHVMSDRKYTFKQRQEVLWRTVIPGTWRWRRQPQWLWPQNNLWLWPAHCSATPPKRRLLPPAGHHMTSPPGRSYPMGRGGNGWESRSDRSHLWHRGIRGLWCVVNRPLPLIGFIHFRTQTGGNTNQVEFKSTTKIPLLSCETMKNFDIKDSQNRCGFCLNRLTDQQLWRRRWKQGCRTPGPCPRPTWICLLLKSPGRWRW